MDILGLGMSLIDSVQVVDTFPASGGVTEVKASVTMGGGPVPTALCTAARMGASSGIIDRIGDDWRGDLIVRDYQKYGVATTFLEQEEDRQSSIATVLVRKSDGERHIVFQRGDSNEITPHELPHEALKSCRFLHLNGRHWAACLEAARLVKEAGGSVSFDGGANRYDDRFNALFPLVDILIVAREFAEKQAGTEDPEEQLRSLAQFGAEVVGITAGDQGSRFLLKNGETFHQPAFLMEETIDTTGCGDAFHGAFLFAANRGDSWTKCARFASAAAAHNATKLGGRGKLATAVEVEELMK